MDQRVQTPETFHKIPANWELTESCVGILLVDRPDGERDKDDPSFE